MQKRAHTLFPFDFNAFAAIIINNNLGRRHIYDEDKKSDSSWKKFRRDAGKCLHATRSTIVSDSYN